jgi:uncharacterized protein (DUF2342 family)
MQQQIFEKIFGTKSNHPDSAKLLSEMTEKYPYFSVAHYFQLKFSDKANSDYSSLAAKAAYFFENPLWLQRQLSQIESENNEVRVEETEEISPQLSKISTENQQNSPLFEPLFATDYFASQGIKFNEQAVNNEDKLGNQLKSFTQWLKTMKKIHGNQIPETASTIDSSVELMAEKSNIEAEIITESMAEVFIQQNKFNKAIEIYTKLSLQNPSKSPYFATKIESLKVK